MKKPHRSSDSSTCPCGKARPYDMCCGVWHAGWSHNVRPHDAEALMRSRYTAYTLGLEHYLLATWHPDTRPAELRLDEDTALKWTGLTIIPAPASHGNEDANEAQVEFTARYKRNGKAEKLHEVSRFIRVEGDWYYVDGTFTG